MVQVSYCRTKADEIAVEQGCYFDEAEAEKIITFAEKYFIPQFVPGRFRLLQWQKEWLRTLTGWRLPDGRRRWRKVLLTVSKKNGKNLLASIVSLYETYGANVPSPLVISASTTKENARQIYDELKNSIVKNERLASISKLAPSMRIIRVAKKNAEFRSISNDSGNAEGLNISCAVCDEVHAWKSEQLYRTLEYSTIARPDGCLIIISTAGHDQGHFFYDLYTKAKAIISGDDVDTSFFPTVYESQGDIDDVQGWMQANPSMGVSFTLDDFKRDLETAKADTASRLSFERYRLNKWVRADDSFIDPVEFDACRLHRSDDELKFKPLIVGVDLSQTTDPCSISLCWALGDRQFHVKSHAWVCEEGVRRNEATNLPKYRAFKEDKVMTITDGNCNDYRAIKRFILDLRNKYNLKEIVFDQYNAIEMASELMSEGLTVFRQPQTHKYFTSPCKDFEVAIKEKRISHDGNRFLRWALANTRLDVDALGNCKPSRDKSTDKIDACVSTLMAFGRAVEMSVNGGPRRTVYDDRGIFVL